MKDEHYYTRALKLDTKNSAEYYLGRADFYCLEYEFEKAYEDYNEASKLGVNVENNLHFINCKEYIFAYKHIEDITKEMEKSPQNYKLYCQRAKFYYLRKQYEAVINDINTAIKINPCESTYDYMYEMAKKIRERNIYDAVNNANKESLINALKHRIELATENIKLGNNNTYWQWRAEKDLDKIIELAKDKTLALYLKVNFYEKINNSGNAILFLKRVVELSKERDDNFGKTLTYLYKNKLANLYTREMKLNEARKLILNSSDLPDTSDIQKGIEYINSLAFICVDQQTEKLLAIT